MPIISFFLTKESSDRPVLVNFQNGRLKPTKKNRLKSDLHKNKKNETVVAIENDKMAYAGIVNKTDLYNNYIVINNKKTNKCRLIQVDMATLQPLLDQKVDHLNVTISAHEKSISNLNKQFGSKRTIRQTEQMERMKMNIDAVKDDLERTVADVHIESTEFGAADEEDGVYKPKINRHASTVEQVYILEDLLPENLLNSLEDEATQIMANLESLDELKFKPYVESCVKQLIALGLPEDAVKEKMKVLIYLHYLLSFFSTPVRSMPKKFVICNNRDVNFHILDNFSTLSGASRLRPISMKTKALCYTMVLTALIMDYEVNIEELSKDLKLGIKKMKEIGRVLAFSPSKVDSVMVLKLPLPAVVTVSAKRKKK